MSWIRPRPGANASLADRMGYGPDLRRIDTAPRTSPVMLSIGKLGAGQEAYYTAKVAEGAEDYYQSR